MALEVRGTTTMTDEGVGGTNGGIAGTKRGQRRPSGENDGFNTKNGAGGAEGRKAASLERCCWVASSISSVQPSRLGHQFPSSESAAAAAALVCVAACSVVE